MSTKNYLSEIELVLISVGPNNPRKTFDEKSLKELSQSIKDKGVLQPLLVRPDADGFELVCGERRYRAASMAGLKKIPCNVRELDDDQAFEMQITENLERKDVHPLEEAEAFHKMLESKKYTIADLAAKFAKPETFIAQRLKFVDLIDEIKEDFYQDELGIGHAVLLARLSHKQQKDIFESTTTGWDRGYGTIDNLKAKIDRGTHDLSEAAFSTTRDELAKGGKCACAVCPKRSGANPVLFADIEDPDICFDVTCYEEKLTAHIEHTLARIINDGEDVVLGKDYNEVPEFVETLAKQYKMFIHHHSDFTTSITEKSKTQKLLWVSGSRAGKIEEVRFYQNTKGSSKSKEPSIQDQIDKVQERAKRALELDNVKIFNAIKDDKRLYDEYAVDNEAPLTELEIKAMWYLFTREVLDYHALDKYQKIVGAPNSYRDTKEFEFYKSTPIEKLRTNQLVRMAIKDKLTSMHEPNFESCTRSKFFFEIIKEQMPKSVQEIIDSQNEIAKKRIERSTKKIEDLKAQLPVKKKPTTKKKKPTKKTKS